MYSVHHGHLTDGADTSLLLDSSPSHHWELVGQLAFMIVIIIHTNISDKQMVTRQ